MKAGVHVEEFKRGRIKAFVVKKKKNEFDLWP